MNWPNMKMYTWEICKNSILGESKGGFFPFFFPKYDYENESQRESTVEVEPVDVRSGDESNGWLEGVGFIGESHWTPQTKRRLWTHYGVVNLSDCSYLKSKYKESKKKKGILCTPSSTEKPTVRLLSLCL